MGRAANPELPQLLKHAAIDVFSEHGLAAAKISDITTLAGASKGAFYIHFVSKETLYVQIAREFLDEVARQLAMYGCAPGTLPADPMAYIRDMQDRDRELLDFFWEQRKPLAMVVRGALGTPCAFLFDEFIDTIQRTMVQTITSHPMPPGQAGQVSADFLAAMATGLLYMHTRRVTAASQPPEVHQGIAHFRKILMLGVLLPPAALDSVLTDPLSAFVALGIVPTDLELCAPGHAFPAADGDVGVR